ncbi:MAG: septum formation initiator family protein [Verrucomicrobiota bacterium]
MNVDLGIWGKLTKVVIFLFALAIVLIVVKEFLPVIHQNERMRQEVIRLDAQISKSEETLRQSKSQIDALRYDPKAVERLARERLGYAKPGETVIRFEPAATNTVARQ